MCSCKAIELDSQGYDVEDKRKECVFVENGKHYYMHEETKEILSADDIFFENIHKCNHLKYIGDKETYDYLVNKWGITKFDVSHYSHNVISVGFNEKEQKWYGWSHRAIAKFGIGYVVDETATTINARIDIGYEVKTLNGARHLAEIFAESVS